MRGVIKNSDYEMEYFVYGSGKKILFAFHGYNNHANDFKVFENYLGKEYTIVSVNLFFHGDSHAMDHLVEKGFSIDDLRIFFDELALLFPAEKYSLMGYSLGGRFALKLLEVIPEKIERIILLASDGIHINMMYRFLTQTWLGKIVLKKVVDHPGLVFTLGKIIWKTGLVSEKRYQFTLSNYDTKSKREKVYRVWMTMRKIVSKNSHVKFLIRKYYIPMHLFFGKHDQIIPPEIGKKFQKGMEELISLNILDSGHQILKEMNLTEIASKLLENKNDLSKP